MLIVKVLVVSFIIVYSSFRLFQIAYRMTQKRREMTYWSKETDPRLSTGRPQDMEMSQAEVAKCREEQGKIDTEATLECLGRVNTEAEREIIK